MEKNIPGITAPLEFGYFEAFDYLTAPVVINRLAGDGRGFLVFVPHYFPEVFFGGYLAFFQFLVALREARGVQFKLVVIKQSNTATNLEKNILRVKESAPDVAELFSDFHPLVENRTIDVNGNYGVISFCTETHFLARSAADQLNVDPIFFVSEYEPDFHAPGSLKTFTRSTFDLPHIGLYNTRKLYEYFRDHTDIAQLRDPSYRFVSFENDIKRMPWDLATFRARHAADRRRHLIVYARPEPLGARNEFAIAMLALKRCIERGDFDETRWKFSGIGSLTQHAPRMLSERSRIDIIPKLPTQEYEDYILQGDIGISLISTPHPGIVHYQMANFGLATVTYAHAGRSPEWLRTQSKNLIPSAATIDGLCHAIGEAIEASADLEARYRNAVSSVQYESAEVTIARAVRELLAYI